MKWKKIVSAALCIVTAAGILAGCGNSADNKTAGSKDNKTNQDKAMGRYIEEELKPPIQEGERPLGAYQKDGTVFLHTYLQGGEESVRYYEYQYKDGAWSEAKEDNALAEKSAEVQPQALNLGQDKNVYILGINISDEGVYGGRILKRSEDSGGWEDITPENLTKADDLGYGAIITDIDALEDGSLCVSNGSAGQAEVYKEGEKIFSCPMKSMNSDIQNNISAQGDKLAVMGEDGKTIHVYKGDDFSENGSIPLEGSSDDSTTARFNFGSEATTLNIAGGEGDIWYGLTEDGIFRLQESGTIVENLMDGSYGKMGAVGISVVSFFTGAKDDFYALYRDEAGFYLNYYTFDKDMPTSADKTLTVYSLKENKTVRQAVSVYQSLNPDVKVEYNFAVGEYEKPSSEQIRSLNTELLSGDGPDVILLDGLPVDSYIEKGILADLSAVRKELGKDGNILENVADALNRDGKVYGIPARVGLPVIAGNEEVAGALKNIDDFTAYLKENADSQIFIDTTHNRMGKALFSILQESLIKKDGSMDEGNLQKLLDAYMQICTNMDTRYLEEEGGYEPGQDDGLNIYFSAGSWGKLGTGNVSAHEMQGLNSMMYPCYAYKEAGVTPETINGYYVPYTIAGVNAASKQQELAEDFVKELFADDIQGSQTEDGLPVTESALKALASYADSQASDEGMQTFASYKDPKTGERIEMTYGYPDGKTVESYAELLRKTKKPYLPNQTMIDTVMEEMEKCYEGTATTEEAAKAITQKMDTYLSE